ncbi:TIGR03032 family protein [Bacteroidota bacterium]
MQKPFFYYNNAFPEFLKKNNLSIVVSTYQAGKVIIISSLNGKTLQLYAKNFSRPMGIAVKNDQLAIASKSKVDLFSNSYALAKHFPQKPNYYDALFVPQTSYSTGMADIHEIEWGNEGLWAVNTSFSCLCQMDDEFSFIPKWKPDFISEIAPEDRCHLNGLAMKDGKPAYVTLFDKTDTKNGWRNRNTETGMIIEIETNKIIAEKLPMPHSPLLHNDKLYFLLSATGEVMKMDINTKQIDQVAKLDNFVRGMDLYKDYLIISSSELRSSSKAFDNLSIENKNCSSGIYIIERESGELIGKLTFSDHIKEIFSVKALQNISKAAIITENDKWAHQFIYAPQNLNYWIKQK